MFVESGYCLNLNNAIYVLSITWNLFVSKLANVSYILMFGYNDITISFNSHIFLAMVVWRHTSIKLHFSNHFMESLASFNVDDKLTKNENLRFHQHYGIIVQGISHIAIRWKVCILWKMKFYHNLSSRISINVLNVRNGIYQKGIKKIHLKFGITNLDRYWYLWIFSNGHHWP